MKQHEGVDFDVPVGTPVRSTASGKVMLAGPPGANVKKGEVIAYSGRSGLASTAHLHYEVVRNGKNVDPKLYIHRSAEM